ncbi:MAG: hypothetical protein ACI9W2_002349 [Gammaproteobacteria bacterium]|jgi:hypothetical protein
MTCVRVMIWVFREAVEKLFSEAVSIQNVRYLVDFQEQKGWRKPANCIQFSLHPNRFLYAGKRPLPGASGASLAAPELSLDFPLPSRSIVECFN